MLTSLDIQGFMSSRISAAGISGKEADSSRARDTRSPGTISQAYRAAQGTRSEVRARDSRRRPARPLNGVTGDPERLEQGAYSLVSLMARYEFNARLPGQIAVDNLLDEVYYN